MSWPTLSGMSPRETSDPGEVAFYHGTRRPFNTGGLVLPGDKVGVDHHNLGRSDWVYVTTDLELAKDYARAAAGKGRAKVVQVRPWGDLYIDDSTVNGEEQDSYRCEAASVLLRVWMETPEEAQAHRQGLTDPAREPVTHH